MDFAALKKLDQAALRNEAFSLKKELFNLRLTTLAGQVKDVSQFRKLRVKIAQCLTLSGQSGVVVTPSKGKTKK